VHRGEDPLAALSWLYEGGTRIPGVCVLFDPNLLRRGASRKIFRYDGLTSDPRFETFYPSRPAL